MRSSLFLMLFLLFSAEVTKVVQAPSVKGKILNQVQEPIEGATVYLVTSTAKAVLKTAITKADGSFTILDYPRGTFIIEVTALGFSKGETIAFKVDDKGIELPPIVLASLSREIAAVTVSRELPLIQFSNGKLVMNVENSSVSAGNNALEILERAPGVSVDKDGNISLMGQQGVNVTIDGRPTYMSGEQLATFLKSTDGSQIKSIELATTRSAKDDAEGSAGVINILLKKNKLEGFNGTVVASAAYGKEFRGNSSINLNYKKNNSNFFGSYAYTNDNKISNLDIMRIIPDVSLQTVFDQFGQLRDQDKTHNYKFGLEQKTSNRNTLLLQFSGNNNDSDQENPGTTYIGKEQGLVDSIMRSGTTGRETFSRYTFNANNEFKIDTLGKKLTTDIDYSLFKTNNIMNYAYHTFYPDGSYIYDPEYEKSNALTDIKIFAAKLDYTQHIGKGIVETGIKYSKVESENGSRFEQLINDGWQDNARRSNVFDYTENILAGYLDYNTKINKWEIKTGLRGEYTRSEGNSVTENKFVKRDYFDLFPSASLSYNYSDNHVFTMAYARKVTRPNYKNLNPFEYYLDKRTFIRGNPYLNPQYTDGFSFNYTLFRMFNVALGHDITRDAMVESMGQDIIAKTSWVTRENLGRQSSSYINLTIPARIGKFWTMYNNLTGIYMHFKGPIAGYSVSQGSIFFQGNSTHNFKISKGFTTEVSLRYNSPFLYNVYRIDGRFNSDVGMTYNFKDERSTLKLAVIDVLHSNHNNLSTSFEEFNSAIRQYHDSQTVRLTFNYKFGNLKQSIKRKEQNSEEKERAQ